MKAKNIERALKAEVVISRYNEPGGSMEENMIDLLNDMMHHMQEVDESFDKVLEMARKHYEAEK